MSNLYMNTKTVQTILFVFLFNCHFATTTNIYKEYIDIYIYHSYISIYIHSIYLSIYLSILIYTVLHMKCYV